MALTAAYGYTALGAPDGVRLLEILPGEASSPMSCDIFHTSLSTHPQYEALSYAWGNPDFSHIISVNSSCLAVSTNLHEALQRLRLPLEKRTMWIDAICIDQANVAERSQQVGMMQNIFSHATNVVV